ncbi:MAG: nitrite reductase/ring-hydroxylating ferredoxin subunit [Halioglobus sp.]|jgi:nitrite reductase/ring-hydroxylating ferredoxin subunit
MLPTQKTRYRYPFSPFPSGWFAIGSCEGIHEGQIENLSYFGRELIAFRDAEKQIRVLNAYCAHLGAHLGIGGTLEEGHVVCPFHGWRYDGRGQCVDIPYSDHIPPRGKLHAYPVMEWAGLLLVYFSENDTPPSWTPDLPLFDPLEWTVYASNRWTVRVHIQEIGENGLDMPHFKTVHSAEVPQMTRAEGIDQTFFISVRPTADSAQAQYLDGIDRTLWGLGISVNSFEGAVPSRVVITRTPIDEQLSEITLVFIPKTQGDAQSTAAFGQALMEHISKEIEQDVPIWENKAYSEHPALTTGDGPIAAWRHWCEQFYIKEN